MRASALAATVLLLVAAPIVAGAQPGKVHRVAFLGPAAEFVYREPLLNFREGLRELGRVEGKDIVLEYRFADDRTDRLPGLATELVRNRADVIVAHGTPGARAAKEATGTIPIVMVSIGDPVGAGIVASLARPGGNITGVSNVDVGVAAKRLELLKELVPTLARVAVLRNPASASGQLQFKETQAAAQSLRIQLHVVDARAPSDVEVGLKALTRTRVDALVVLGDPLFLSQQKQIAELASASRLPSIFARRENVDAGGLMSYGPTLADQFRLAATYVDKILKGAKPADLPIEQPTRLTLVVNLKTAKGLGLTIPQSLRLRADQVIE